MAKSETLELNGVVFRRYPESKHESHRRYYSPNGTHRAKGIGAYHQELWKSHYGPIPEGYEIHHRDGNPLNNDISNLECVTPKAHRQLHVEAGTFNSAAVKANLSRIRPLASAWHRSEAGREWHRKHAAVSIAIIPKVELCCSECGVKFISRPVASARPDGARFCSQACTARTRRREKRQAVAKTCQQCGKEFLGFPRVKTCSRECGAQMRWRTVGRSAR